MRHKGDRLKDLADGYEKHLRAVGREMAEIANQYYYGKRYKAVPGAPWWVRLAVRYKNWRARREEMAGKGTR